MVRIAVGVPVLFDGFRDLFFLGGFFRSGITGSKGGSVMEVGCSKQHSFKNGTGNGGVHGSAAGKETVFSATRKKLLFC